MAVIEFSNLFGRLIMDDLIDFERTNEFVLPEDYRNFLIEHNGGRPKPNTVKKVNTDVNWLYSFCEEPDWASFYYAIDIYQGRLPSWYIPIGYDSGGNLFIMSLFKENKGVIALWLHEREHPEDGSQYFDNVVLLADNFDQFIEDLK